MGLDPGSPIRDGGLARCGSRAAPIVWQCCRVGAPRHHCCRGPNRRAMFRQVRRGRWSNVDASKPSERPVTLRGLSCWAGCRARVAPLKRPQSFLVRGMLHRGGVSPPRGSSDSAGSSSSYTSPSLRLQRRPCLYSVPRSATRSSRWSPRSSGLVWRSHAIAFTNSWSAWCSVSSPELRLFGSKSVRDCVWLEGPRDLLRLPWVALIRTVVVRVPRAGVVATLLPACFGRAALIRSRVVYIPRAGVVRAPLEATLDLRRALGLGPPSVASHTQLSP